MTRGEGGDGGGGSVATSGKVGPTERRDAGEEVGVEGGGEGHLGEKTEEIATSEVEAEDGFCGFGCRGSYPIRWKHVLIR